MVGFLTKESEPINFLSLEREEKFYTAEIYREGYPYEPWYFVGIEIVLSNKKRFIKRQAYTFMDLLGDFGGFNDALFFFGGILLVSYSSKIYMASIAAELPTKSSK